MVTTGSCHVSVKDTGCACFGPRTSEFQQGELILEVLEEGTALQGVEQGCILWMSNRCFSARGVPEVFLTYNFLSRAQTERVAIKLSKLDKMILKEDGTVACSLHVSSKDFMHLQSIQKAFVPLVMRMLEQIALYNGLYKGTGPVGSFLGQNEVVISFENGGFQLMKALPNGSVSHTMLLFNPTRGCMELSSPPQTGRSLFAGSEKNVIVHNLAGAIALFREGIGWPVSTQLVSREPSQASEVSESSSNSELGSSILDEDEPISEPAVPPEVIGRKHRGIESKDEKGMMTAVMWEHGALQTLVNMVAGLTWSKDYDIFELAQKAAEALLGNERVGSPIAETFIRAVCVVIKERGTECLAIYKLLLAVLDIPSVKQAALKYRFMDSLVDQYEMMTQDSYSSSSICSTVSFSDSLSNVRFNHTTEQQATATHTEDGTHVALQTTHSTSPDALWAATPTSSAAHMMLTGSEGTLSTLSLELADSSWGGVMRTTSPAPSSKNPSHSSPVYDNMNKPDVPMLTFYWLKSRDMMRSGAGSATLTTIGLPDGRAIVLDEPDDTDENRNGLPPIGSRSAHVCKFTSDKSPTRLKKCNFDRVTPRTVHAWGVPCEDPEETHFNIVYQIKCAILEALLGFSALNMGEDRGHFELDTDHSMDERLTDGSGETSKYSVNPSRLAVSELLTPTWQVFPGEQPPVTRGPGNRGSALALAIVHEFACRPPQGIQSLGVSGVKHFMPQDQAGDSYHALVGGVKNRLSDLMSGQRRDYCVLEEAVSLVNLLGEFAASTPAPALVQLVAYSCSDTFVHMETALFRSQRAYLWTISVRRVFHALLQLFKSMLERAGGDVVFWQFLNGTLMGRSHWVRLVKDYSKVVLFADKLAKEHDAQELECLRSALWGYFTALASVVAQHRESCDDNITSFEYQTTSQTFGRDSLDHMEYLVSPENGLAVSVLRKSHWGQCSDDTKVNTSLHVQVLTFLKTLFSVPRNNFIAQNDTSLFYLDFHWSSFKRLYQEAAIANTEVGPVCTLHLQVIKEMMTHRWTHVFYQVKCLGILDLLSDEISLELREHTAKKLSAFLPPGSSLAMKSSLQDPSRQVPFPGTEYTVTEGELGGKRYVESMPQSRTLRGKEKGLTPLEEATEDEGKALSPVASQQLKHPESLQALELVSVDTKAAVNFVDTVENKYCKNTKGEDIEPLAQCSLLDLPQDGRILANKFGSNKVAGATDGRKVYRLKSQEVSLNLGMPEDSDLTAEADTKKHSLEGQIHTCHELATRASMIPKAAAPQSLQTAPILSTGESVFRIRARRAISRKSEDFTSGDKWSCSLEESECQQTSRSASVIFRGSVSKIPRLPSALGKNSRDTFATPRGRGRSVSRGGGRGRKRSGSIDQSPGTPASIPASRNGLKLPIGKTADPVSGTKQANTKPKIPPSESAGTKEKQVTSRPSSRVKPATPVGKPGTAAKKSTGSKPTGAQSSGQKAAKETSVKGPVLAPELQPHSLSPQTKDAKQMQAVNTEKGDSSAKDEEGKGAKTATGIVPSLDLTCVIGVQNTSSPNVDVEIVGTPRSSGSSFASSDSSRSSEFDFPEQTDQINTQPGPLRSGGANLIKPCAGANDTSGVSDSLRDPRNPYITPNSGFASEGDTSGPPTFGVVCRARPSREPPQRTSPNPNPVNFDFGHASVSSNRLIDSDDATSFVPPSDFEYTGDMSDDARRLHSLERKYYGYASSDGTLSVMETIPPCRPNIVPPIHFPGVGVVQGISRSCSISSSRNSQGGRKKLHHRHSKHSIADSKKGFAPYRRQASGSRASMAESRRSMWDRPPTAMDTRSTLDSFCTEQRSGSSFQIPDDFDWTGDASDDCRRLEILERRQKKGDFVSSSSGPSFTDTLSEDMRMSPVPAMGFGVKKLTLPATNGFARTSHSTAGKSRLSCRTPSDLGQGSGTRPSRPNSAANCRTKCISDFDDALEAVGDWRRMERMDQHCGVVHSLRAPSAPTIAPHPNHIYDSARRYNLPLIQYGNDFPLRKLSHSRKSSSTSGHNPPATSSFLYPIGGKHGFRGDGLNESPRMGPRPTDIWNHSLKPLWSQATCSSQRSVHYSALQWNLNETKGDCVGESEVNRLLSAGKARKEHEATRKKQCAEPAPDGPLCLKSKRTEAGSAQSTAATQTPYAEARKQRAAYKDKELHAVLVEVLLEGVLLEEETRVNRDDERDDETQKIVRDLPSVLLYHLNHDCAFSTVMALRRKVFGKGNERSRLLRLLVRSLFPAELYKSNKRMAKGAFAHVHQCSLPIAGGPATCAAKVVDLPGEGTDEKTLLDLYSEVSILEKFQGVPYICDLYDYGVTHESAYLIMKEYKCSLLEWRQHLPKRCPDSIRLFLRIFRNIVNAVKQVHEQNVVHFDLKCSNILIDPFPDTSEDQVWAPLTEEPPFNVVIADFGEARSYTNSWEAQTVRNRGTEFNKSPEMLKISDAVKRDLPEFDRRKRQGAGPPSDVWALGCLMFELVTGQMLQYDDDWARFFVRVTRSALPVLSEEKLTLLDDQSHGVIIELLEFMLVRDQSWRPSVTMLLRRLDTVLNKATLPPYCRAPVQTLNIVALPSPVDRFAGVSMFGEICEWHSDIIRLTNRHLLMSMSAACNPWILSKHYTSTMVLIRGHQVTSDVGALRTATARASIELIEINIGSNGGDGDGIRDEHLPVLKTTRRSACVGLACQPAYKRELVTLILRIFKGECGYEHYGGLLELWRRLKN